MLRDLTMALGSAVFVAVVATFGDYVWASRLLAHRMTFGLLHGAGLCLAIGLAIGFPAGRPFVGAAGGLVVGVASAASFYVLAPVMGYPAMFASWVLLWLLIALLDQMLRGGGRHVWLRGVVAALASGAAFFAVSGMWTRWDPANINYVDHFLRWSVALLPGFLALHLGSDARPAARR